MPANSISARARSSASRAIRIKLMVRSLLSAATSSWRLTLSRSRNGTGARSEGKPEYYELASRLIHGQTLLAKVLHDVRVALDYLATRCEVDPTRIGFIGHSYGGRMAIWASACDERIRAAVSNCGCVN